jgi:hypothetical protein
MDSQTIAVLRDISVMILCVEIAILVAIPGVMLFFAQKYLRQGRKWLHVPFLRVQVAMLRAQELTLRASYSIIEVPIRVQMLRSRVVATARALVERS